MTKDIDQWRKARNGITPCEHCKRHLSPGEWYWGRFYSRWCYDCAPGVATEPPPTLLQITTRWDPVQEVVQVQEFTWAGGVTDRTWAGGPMYPPCQQPCPEHVTNGELDCPFGTCPMKRDGVQGFPLR